MSSRNNFYLKFNKGMKLKIFNTSGRNVEKDEYKEGFYTTTHNNNISKIPKLSFINNKKIEKIKNKNIYVNSFKSCKNYFTENDNDIPKITPKYTQTGISQYSYRGKNYHNNNNSYNDYIHNKIKSFNYSNLSSIKTPRIIIKQNIANINNINNKNDYLKEDNMDLLNIVPIHSLKKNFSKDSEKNGIKLLLKTRPNIHIKYLRPKFKKPNNMYNEFLKTILKEYYAKKSWAKKKINLSKLFDGKEISQKIKLSNKYINSKLNNINI